MKHKAFSWLLLVVAGVFCPFCLLFDQPRLSVVKQWIT